MLKNSAFCIFLLLVMVSNAQGPFEHYHNPEMEDSVFLNTHLHLITAAPTKANHIDYYTMACTLYTFGRNAEAKKMLLKIEKSDKPYYTATYNHNSDVPGDTTTNSYGYGSYTTNYKSYACMYLARIHIEEKQFDKGLEYTAKADTLYPVVFTCGTGYYMQRMQYDELYNLCYHGLGKFDSYIDLEFSHFTDYPFRNSGLVATLKSIYTPEDISKHIDTAIKSITLGDLYNGYAVSSAKPNDTLRYVSADATILLFDRKVKLSAPWSMHGDTITVQDYVDEFLTSDFYVG